MENKALLGYHGISLPRGASMEIRDTIKRLKEEKKAVILAHNYQLPEVQDIADFVGDSLGLSIEAAKTEAKVIVFCGVHFMAETAKILSPEKTVLLAEKEAGCPMADMITGEMLLALKKKHPGASVLCYVNTSAEVKAESDLCCTSANAIKMVRELRATKKEIIFVPDKYLADYTAKETGHSFIVWDGYCPIHAAIRPEHIKKQKELHPQALVLVHPECPPEVIELADHVSSTEGMCRLVQDSPDNEFIIATEEGIIHRMKKENPEKVFYPLDPTVVCPDMKKTSLNSIHRALAEGLYEIKVPEVTLSRARRSIERMIALSK